MAKTIFNSSEKSNFIINMRPSTVRRITAAAAIATPILLMLGGLIVALGGENSIASTALSLCGIFSFFAFTIIAAKSGLDKNIILPVVLWLAMLAVAAVSAFASFDRSRSIFGNYGRFEGILALICYFGIFLVGYLIHRRKGLLLLFDVLVCVGAVQCVFALLQLLPFVSFPSWYTDLNILVMYGTNLPDGTTGSPIFLAAYLSLLCGIAFLGSCYDRTPLRRTLYTLASLVFIIVGVLTQSFVAAVGIAAVIIVSFVIEIIRIASGRVDKSKDATFPIIRIVIYALAYGVTLAIILSGTGFLDGGIMWQDSFYRLFVTGTHSQNSEEFPNVTTFDATKLNELYGFLWNNTIGGMKKYDDWLLGSGPDCLFFTQLRTISAIISEPDSFDRCYNDYLYIMATRGIPSLVLYLGIIGVALKRSGKRLAALFKKDDEWLNGAAFCAVCGYLVLSFFNAGAITVAPIFWLLLGCCTKKSIED